MIKHLTAGALAIAAFAPAMEGQALAQAAPASPSAEEIRQADAHSEEEWNYSVGIQNYVFTLPLIKATVLAEAAMEGRLPRGFCVKRLTDLPMLWSEQWRAVGLQQPIQAQAEPI